MFNIKKNILKVVAASCLVMMPTMVHAEEGTSKTADTIEAIPEKAIMNIQIGYEFSDGSFDVWASGTGTMVSESDMVTTETLTDDTTSSLLYKKVLSERGDAYEKLGISLKSEKETAQHIKIKVSTATGSKVEITTKNFKQGIGVIGLASKQPQYMSFTDTNAGLETNAPAKALYVEKNAVVSLDGTVTAKSQTSEEYIFAGNTAVATGSPIVNSKYSIMGIVSSSVDNNSYFIPNERIQSVLSENGIEYKTEGQVSTEKEKENKEKLDEKRKKEELASLDTDELEKAIKSAEDVDTSEYTPQSVEKLNDAIKAGKDLLEDDSRTQKKIDAAVTDIKDAQDALETKGLLQKFPFLPYVFGGVVAIAIIVAILKVQKKKRQKLEAEILKEQEDYEEDFSQELGNLNHDPHLVDNKTGRRVDMDDMDITVQSAPRSMRITKEARTDLDYAREDEGANILDDGAEGTTLLSSSPLTKNVYMIRQDTGEQVNITKDGFIIGKERAKVDYCISGNTTISRTHATFHIVDGEICVEDLGSKNFTYINGRPIPEYTPVKLVNGMLIQFSNVRFQLFIED